MVDGDGRQVVDVVVVGSGAGALTGALLAARRGLDTLVLEKTPLLGGTSAYSGAAMWLPGTPVQERAGLDDSTAAARTYLTGLLPTADPARIDAFLDAAPELVALLEAEPAIELAHQAFPDYVDAPGRHPVGRSIVPLELDPARLGEARLARVRPPVHRDRAGRGHGRGPLDGGRALIGRLLLAAEDAGAEVRTEAPMRRLLTEGDEVVGVEADTADGPVEVLARRGVLLAAGGYEGDQARRTVTGVPGHARWSMAPAGANTGDALRAAVEVGAATDLLGEGWFCPALEHTDGPAFLLGVRSGILVDRHGERFANECRPYDQMGRILAEDPDGRVPCWFVFDAREGGELPALSVPGTRAEDYLADGRWARGERLADLAEAIDVPGDRLEATVARFDDQAAAGRDDDFGRGRDPYDRFFVPPVEGFEPCLLPLDRAPFTAARVVLGDLGTKGGLATDVDARVLRDGGSAIAGLYATSNTVASLSGAVYPGPGIPLGTSMVGAYKAVEHLAG